MAWCPKCKNEFREGIYTCPDCGCALVDEEQFDDQVAITFGELEPITALAEYLQYNKITGVEVKLDEEEQVYELLVRKAEKAAALAMAKVFVQQKTQQEANIVEKDSETKEVIPVAYKSSSEQAEENRTSAWTSLLSGIIGLTVMALGMLDILPFHVGNPYMFYGVMSAIFILFLVMGVVSMRNAKIFAQKAESENSLRDIVKEWCEINLDAQSIDEEVKAQNMESFDVMPEEVLYFQRTEIIKKRMNHQFVNLNQSFVDSFIDEVVYEMVFGE